MKHAMILASVACVALASYCPAQEPAKPEGKPAPQLEDKQRWVFTFSNFAKDETAGRTTDLMKRAKAAGYNGIIVCDTKFEKFAIVPPNVADNLKKFRQECTAQKMKFIAGVTPFGYADAFLANDPNLVEGMPVRQATFIVKDGKLVPFDDTTKLVNGSFEEFKGDKPVGWEVDGAGKVSFADNAVSFDGKSSLRQQDPAGGHCRLWQKIKVLPWHYYHVSAMVKTQDWTGKDMRIFGMAGNPDTQHSVLDWQPVMLEKTQDWKRVDITFCSQDNSEVALYLGSWAPKGGKIWWDDVKIEPGGFVNIIRRDSLPLIIASEDGQTTYEEGKDFTKVVDLKLLNDPNPGYFTIWHNGPVVAVPAGSRLKEGQKVLATYHFATSAGKPSQVNMCMAEPKVYEIVEKQINWMKENGNPDIYLLGHDEIREGGWDDSCVKTGKTPGEILADCIKKCTQIVKKVDPGKGIIVWNDMFDPYHNASPTVKEYYLVKGKGPWAGSWEGVSSDVGVANWHQNNADSLKFFGDRGNQQLLAGYYDADPKRIVEWLKTASETKNVVGVIYTTWQGDYSNLEKFIDYVNKFEQENTPKTK
jgi:hypothetical protein